MDIKEVNEEAFEDTDPEVAEYEKTMNGTKKGFSEGENEFEQAKNAEEQDAKSDVDAEAAEGEAEEAEENSDNTGAAEEAGQDNDQSADSGESASSAFKRKKKKDKRDEQIEELNDRVRRQMAEFDNFRKRTEKEKAQMFETGAKNIIEKILPVVDNFERGLSTIPEEEKENPFVDGMEKIYKQMLTVLEDAGVTPIEAVGKEFDPNLHNAVMHEDNDEVGENIVVQEFQKGYMYRDSVVRHSMVKVAN